MGKETLIFDEHLNCWKMCFSVNCIRVTNRYIEKIKERQDKLLREVGVCENDS